MTIEWNPYDKAANPGLHGLIEAENMSRALGGAPKDPYSGRPLNPQASQGGGDVGTGIGSGAGGIAFLFFLPAFAPFVYAGIYSYLVLTVNLDAPTFFGWIGALVAFVLTFLLALKAMEILPRWLRTPLLVGYMVGTHYIATRFFTVNPWWLYSCALLAGLAGWVLANGMSEKTTAPTLKFRAGQLLLVAALGGAVTASVNYPPIAQVVQAWWRFGTTSPKPWDDYWSTTMPTLLPGAPVSIETTCRAAADSKYPSGLQGGARAEYFKACVQARGQRSR